MNDITPYISDILSQPHILRASLEQFPNHAMDELVDAYRHEHFSRIVLTGMGASLTCVYPAWLTLARSGMPVSLIDTSELIHYAPAQVDAKTLLWVISQSGFSAEIVTLLNYYDGEHSPAAKLGITNDPESPLGRKCRPVLNIYAGLENTVSSRTYMNTLAYAQLASLQLIGEKIEPAMNEFMQAVDQIQSYLSKWQDHVNEMKQRIGFPKRMIVVGRGSSMAAVTTAGLTVKEAAKYPLEGMGAAWFRHGPLEVADDSLTLFIFEGSQNTSKMNHDLGVEVKSYGGHVFWISSKEDPELPTLLIPDGGEFNRPLFEILPIQMLSIVLAESAGFEPGVFRHIRKITTTE